MNEFTQGQTAKKEGHSVHYNPYRDRGTPEQYSNWISGWLSANH